MKYLVILICLFLFGCDSESSKNPTLPRINYTLRFVKNPYSYDYYLIENIETHEILGFGYIEGFKPQ